MEKSVQGLWTSWFDLNLVHYSRFKTSYFPFECDPIYKDGITVGVLVNFDTLMYGLIPIFAIGYWVWEQGMISSFFGGID